MRTACARLFAWFVLIGLPAGAQSINVDIGNTYGVPSPAYGAAAVSPGVWNEADMSLPIQTLIPLVDLAGNPTGRSSMRVKVGSGCHGIPSPTPLRGGSRD